MREPSTATDVPRCTDLPAVVASGQPRTRAALLRAALTPTRFETDDPVLATFLRHRDYCLNIIERSGMVLYDFDPAPGIEESVLDYHNRVPFDEGTTHAGHFDYTPLPPPKAIRARCLDCHAGIRKMVKNCSLTDCNLYIFRMRRAKRGSGGRLKAIRRYCVHDCMDDQPKEVRLCPTPWCWLYFFRFGKKSMPPTFVWGLS